MKDMQVEFRCGCTVTYFAASQFRSCRTTCCTRHKPQEVARNAKRERDFRLSARTLDPLPLLGALWENYQ